MLLRAIAIIIIVISITTPHTFLRVGALHSLLRIVPFSLNKTSWKEKSYGHRGGTPLFPFSSFASPARIPLSLLAWLPKDTKSAATAEESEKNKENTTTDHHCEREREKNYNLANGSFTHKYLLASCLARFPFFSLACNWSCHEKALADFHTTSIIKLFNW